MSSYVNLVSLNRLNRRMDEHCQDLRPLRRPTIQGLTTRGRRASTPMVEHEMDVRAKLEEPREGDAHAQILTPWPE